MKNKHYIKHFQFISTNDITADSQRNTFGNVENKNQQGEKWMPQTRTIVIWKSLKVPSLSTSWELASLHDSDHERNHHVALLQRPEGKAHQDLVDYWLSLG